MINYARLYHKLVGDIADAIYDLEHPKDSAEKTNSIVLEKLIASITEAEEMYLDMCEETYPNGEDLEENDPDYEEYDDDTEFDDEEESEE